MKNNYKLSDYIVATDIVDAPAEAEPSRILFATRSGKSVLIKDKVYAALKEGRFSAVSSETMVSLMNLEAVVPAGQNEFEHVLNSNKIGLKGAKRLDVTIQPTANCQLGCNYCGQVHTKKNVDEETSNKITDRICHNLLAKPHTGLSVEWFGAEPLMAFSEILRMSTRLRTFCQTHAIAYQARMITNGLSFKPAVFLKLLEQEVTHFQITLDGLGATHDKLRITKEGGKTFDLIFKNILDVTALPEFQEQKCSITIRVNINNESVRSVHKLIDHLAACGLAGKRVMLDFSPVFDWGGNGAAKEALSKEEFGLLEIDWLMYAMKQGFRFPGIVPARRIGPCMVVKEDAEVYDASGNVYPCYEYPYTPKYASDDYKLGHVDTIAERRNANAVTKNWYEDVKTDIAPCRTCNLFPVCGGGCPKQWYSGDVACPSFKTNIGDRLALDYLVRKLGYLEQGAAQQEEAEHV